MKAKTNILLKELGIEGGIEKCTYFCRFLQYSKKSLYSSDIFSIDK